MIDAIDRFAQRHPQVASFGITSALPLLCALSVPIACAVVSMNRLGFSAGLSFAYWLRWLTAVQIGPVTVSFAIGWYLLPTAAQRAWNIVWCFWSVPAVFACGVAAAILFVP